MIPAWCYADMLHNPSACMVSIILVVELQRDNKVYLLVKQTTSAKHKLVQAAARFKENNDAW